MVVNEEVRVRWTRDGDEREVRRSGSWTLDAAVEYVRVVGPTLDPGDALRVEVVLTAGERTATSE